MAAPNLRSPVSVIGKTEAVSLGTTLAAVISNAAESGLVLKVNAVRASNISTTAATVSIALVRGASTIYFLKSGSVSAGTSLIASDKNEYIYLEEGDALHASASDVDKVHLTVNYEAVS
jgi:hypothetical protein